MYYIEEKRPEWGRYANIDSFSSLNTTLRILILNKRNKSSSEFRVKSGNRIIFYVNQNGEVILRGKQ